VAESLVERARFIQLDPDKDGTLGWYEY